MATSVLAGKRTPTFGDYHFQLSGRVHRCVCGGREEGDEEETNPEAKLIDDMKL